MSLQDLTRAPDIAAEAQAHIDAELDRLEREQGIHILFAIESGSRAWGFPSPDSDFDVRFIYVRPARDYLRVHPVRDVVEVPIDAVYDINGWDLRKALGLLLKANPVLHEWVQSPVRYRWNEEAVAPIRELGSKVGHRRAGLHHYRSLADRQWSAYIAGRDEVRLKKYFYALRPALAIAWMRSHPDTVPPMNVAELVGGLQLPADLLADAQELLRMKSKASETGMGSRRVSVDDFVVAQMQWAEEAAKREPREQADLAEEADQVLFDLVSRYGDA